MCGARESPDSCRLMNRAFFRDVGSLLQGRERRTLFWLVGLVAVTAIVETVGVAAILPFMSLVAAPELTLSSPRFASLADAIGATSARETLIVVGLGVLLLLAVSTSLSAITSWSLLRFANRQGHRLIMRLLVSYLGQPYVFFLGRNSAELVKTLFADTGRITQYVLVPCLQIASRGMSALCITALLFVVEARLAALVVLVLGSGYALAYLLVRGVIARAGGTSLRSAAQRATYAHDTLGGIKEIKVQGRESFFLKRVETSSMAWSDAQAALQILSAVPRYAIELLAFGAVLVLTVYVLWNSNQPATYLPMLALYAFAGLRLMPALQQIFTAAASLRFSAPALKSVLSDLACPAHDHVANDSQDAMIFGRAIEVKSVSFQYPGTQTFQLRNVNLTIPKNSSVAFVGRTGCGKTTLVDILIGLLSPAEGMLTVDDTRIDSSNVGMWRRRIGYVSQHIFLCDGSVASNIAFGVEDEDVDTKRLRAAARSASLGEFMETLPDGYDTLVGERGVRLSGGQRQRIGIARALYHEPDLLVFDEATSALDSGTEAAVMDAIDYLAGSKTIILVAHRISTVRRCDVIHLMESGQIVDSGSFDELFARSQQFRQLAGDGQAEAQTREIG